MGKKIMRSRIQKFLQENGPATCYTIFAHLKQSMSGRIGPTNTRAVSSVCARDPEVVVVGSEWVEKRSVYLYDIRGRDKSE